MDLFSSLKKKNALHRSRSVWEQDLEKFCGKKGTDSLYFRILKQKMEKLSGKM